ncbi:twin-arginine translocation signal domain-containing protein [Berryella wangjianweii]|uniref:Twin-arginine translocation signal domain-containing protein n=1 Tax=Berryella wangjianweii TaxID=2734634 RepID=A0A6M8IXE8_9ACTN|nr:twin-arginine translocation signal domain-containing protein [Berryella wangjianweii]QKF07465.1 twin-arginine translocation signal domain-containing protein [Berryella wangjianweii]
MGNISRRDFIVASGVGVSGLLFGLMESPMPAVANEISDGPSAEELWRRAVERAELQGAEVHYGIPCSDYSTMFRSRVSASAQANTTVNAVPDLVTAVAVYDASGGRIQSLNSTWIHGVHSTTTNSDYSYTLLDSKRTLSIRYTFTLKNYAGFNQSYTGYAEFYASGSGWLKVSYL